MRLSSIVDITDPAYGEWYRARSLGRKITVTLDGVEQTHCRMADEERGEICRCVLTADGHLQTDPDKPDEVWTEVVRGDVRIVLGPKGSDV